MSRSHGRCALACVLSAVSASSLASQARGAVIPVGVHARAEALEWITPWIGLGEQDIDPGQAAGSGRLAQASAAMTSAAETTAFAYADYGFLNNTGTSLGEYTVTPGHAAYAQAITSASFRDDQVVVLADGFAAGTPGVLKAAYLLDRIVSFDLSTVTGFTGDAVVVGGFSIDVMIGSYAVSHTGTWTYDATTGIFVEPVLPIGLIEALVPFQYGVPFTIAGAVEMKLTVYSEGPTTATADVEMSLGPSFIWQGIIDGLPEDATVSSPSVPDWRKPYGIPAPGAGAVAILSGAGIMARRHRRALA